MATAYTSLLGLALPVTGELSGSWGDVVNDSITSLLDSAISGTTTLSADADVTLTTSDGVANEARQAILLWTAGGTTTRNITAPAHSKAYFVINKTSSTQSIVIRGAGPTTGVTVLAGTQSLVVWNGVDFVEVASGNVDGPATSTDNAVARFDGTTGKLIQNSVVTIADTTGNMAGVGTLGVGAITTSGALTYGGVTLSNSVTGTGSMVLSTSPTLVTPALGTPSSATLTNATGLPISTGVSGLGTGVATFLGTPSSANLAAAVTDETGTGALVFASSPTLVTPALGTPSSATLTNATGLPLSTGVTGTLATTNGGTGLTSFTANGVVYASSTSALATGSALTFDGTNLGVNGNANFGNNGSSNHGGYTIGGRVFSLSAAGTNIPAISAATDATGVSTAFRAYTKEIANDTSYAFDIQTGNGTGVTTQKLQVTWGANGLWSSSGLAVTGALSTTGVTTVQAGSAAAPAITTSGDTNTGIFFPAADTIAFSEGGAEAMRIDSAGNVGIGTSSPSAKFHVAASGSDPILFANSGGGSYNSAIWQNNNSYKMAVGIGGGSVGGNLQDTAYVGPISNIALVLQTNNTERMRLDSSGNLGIGTSSPAEKLTVAGNIRLNGNQAVIFQQDPGVGVATGAVSFRNGSGVQKAAVASYYNVADEGAIEFVGPTNGTNMILNSSGNLGLGVTPSAWFSSYRAFQTGSASLFSGGGGFEFLTSNAFVGSGDIFRYIASSLPATAYRFNSAVGDHRWLIAPSGTAGDAISFTQAMTLDASGRLGIGITSPSQTLTVNAIATISDPASSASQLTFGDAASDFAGRIFYNHSSNAMQFFTDGSERARITSGGDLLVGTTSASLGNLGSIFQGAANSYESSITVPASGNVPLRLYNQGTSGTQFFMEFRTASSAVGSITYNQTVTLFNTTSDQRLKENIVDAPQFGSVIDSIQVRSFDWKSNNAHQRAGFVAQELLTVAPEAVHQPADPEEMMAVDYSKLVPMLVKEIQSLRARLAAANI